MGSMTVVVLKARCSSRRLVLSKETCRSKDNREQQKTILPVRCPVSRYHSKYTVPMSKERRRNSPADPACRKIVSQTRNWQVIYMMPGKSILDFRHGCIMVTRSAPIPETQSRFLQNPAVTFHRRHERGLSYHSIGVMKRFRFVSLPKRRALHRQKIPNWCSG